MAGPHNKILIVDDNQELLKVMRMLLTENGYEVYTASNGRTGLMLVADHEPDLVILDLSMPGVDGWEVCRQIRAKSTVPIIILTAAHVTDEDTVKGLDLGANDYIIKPFKNNVLLARIRNAIRWTYSDDDEVDYDDGQLSVHLELRQVSLYGEPLKLTRKEFDILSVLVNAAPRIVSHRELFDKVWGSQYEYDVNYVRIFIGHLRKKVEPDPKNPTYVQNERGVGYRFVKQST